MPTVPFRAAPWESIENLGKKAAQPVKQVAADVASDIKESLGMEVTPGQKQQMARGDQARAAQIRQNLSTISQQMAEAREKREQKWQEQNKPAEPTKQVKQLEKKQKESVLQKMIKSRMGTKEGMQRASG